MFAFLVIEGLALILLQLLPEPEAKPGRFDAQVVWEHERNSFHEEDAELLWKPVPGFERGYVRINSAGLRGPDVGPKEPGRTRILLVGDSVTFGIRTPWENTLGFFLEQMLNSRPDAQEVEVLNAGVIGYTSHQGRILLEQRLREFQPDWVIVTFGYNDHHNAQLSDREKTQRGTQNLVSGWMRKTKSYSALQRIRPRTEDPIEREPVPRVSVDDFRENIRAIAELSLEAGARPCFLTTPIRPDVPMVENLRAIEFSDQTVWMRELDFALGSLPEPAQRNLTEHFLGRAPLDLPQDAENCGRILELSETHSNLSIFHYLLAHCLQVAGQTDRAAEALQLSLQNDTERRSMDRYNETLRQLTSRGEIELIDTAAWFDENPDPADFADVVHLTGDGYFRLARRVSEEWSALAQTATRTKP